MVTLQAKPGAYLLRAYFLRGEIMAESFDVNWMTTYIEKLENECLELKKRNKELSDYYETELREMRCDLRKLRENLNNIRMKCIAIQQICAEV